MPTVRFQSARAQRTAVGVLTATVFTLALLLAWLYTNAHQTPWDVSSVTGEVAGLTAPLPEHWIRTDVREPQPGFASTVSVFEDPVLVGRKLIIGQVEVHTPLSPEVVLREALTQIVRAQPRIYQDREPVKRLRLGQFCAAWYHAESQSQPQSPIFSDRIVVFTRDGRRHWLAALSMPQHFVDRAQDANERILRSLVAGASELSSLSPSPADFAGAMLPPFKVDGALVLTEAGDVPRPIVVVPDTGTSTGHVGVVRVIGTFDPGVDEKHVLYPPAHLARHAAEAMGRKPELKQLGDGPGGGWSVSLTSGTQDGDLQREWRLVPIAPGRAALLEILAEAPMLAATGTLASQVAAALRETPQAPIAADAADALKRGAAVVQGQRDLLPALKEPAWRFFILKRGHQPIGVQVEYVQRRDDLKLPVRGKRIRQIGLASEEVAWADWWASLDAQRLDSAIYHELRQGMFEQNVSYRMVLRDDRLTIRANPAAGSPILWAEDVTEQYLPGFLEETWSMKSIYNESVDAPALVWRSRGLLHPTPWWVRTYKLDAAAAAGAGAGEYPRPAKAAVLLTLRPMYGMDAERFWLDADGNILAAQWQETARLPAGGVTLTRIPTDADSVVRRYPRARDIIRLWQQDASHDEE